eukprot:gene2146-2466_t
MIRAVDQQQATQASMAKIGIMLCRDNGQQFRVLNVPLSQQRKTTVFAEGPPQVKYNLQHGSFDAMSPNERSKHEITVQVQLHGCQDQAVVQMQLDRQVEAYLQTYATDEIQAALDSAAASKGSPLTPAERGQVFIGSGLDLVRLMEMRSASPAGNARNMGRVKLTMVHQEAVDFLKEAKKLTLHHPTMGDLTMGSMPDAPKDVLVLISRQCNAADVSTPEGAKAFKAAFTLAAWDSYQIYNGMPEVQDTRSASMAARAQAEAGAAAQLSPASKLAAVQTAAADCSKEYLLGLQIEDELTDQAGTAIALLSPEQISKTYVIAVACKNPRSGVFAVLAAMSPRLASNITSIGWHANSKIKDAAAIVPVSHMSSRIDIESRRNAQFQLACSYIAAAGKLLADPSSSVQWRVVDTGNETAMDQVLRYIPQLQAPPAPAQQPTETAAVAGGVGGRFAALFANAGKISAAAATAEANQGAKRKAAATAAAGKLGAAGGRAPAAKKGSGNATGALTATAAGKDMPEANTGKGTVGPGAPTATEAEQMGRKDPLTAGAAVVQDTVAASQARDRHRQHARQKNVPKVSQQPLGGKNEDLMQ